MRIAEVAVVGPHPEDERNFIKSISNSTYEIVNEHITFGRFEVNNQLAVHLYGITFEGTQDSNSLDLISKKILGFIVLFRWGSADSFRKAQKLVDYFIDAYDANIIATGHSEEKLPSIPEVFDFGMKIDKQGSFTLCNVKDPVSSKKVLVSLVDDIIDKVD